jgi:hypothetical protein
LFIQAHQLHQHQHQAQVPARQVCLITHQFVYTDTLKNTFQHQIQLLPARQLQHHPLVIIFHIINIHFLQYLFIQARQALHQHHLLLLPQKVNFSYAHALSKPRLIVYFLATSTTSSSATTPTSTSTTSSTSTST